jgi:hypothetical protein
MQMPAPPVAPVAPVAPVVPGVGVVPGVPTTLPVATRQVFAQPKAPGVLGKAGAAMQKVPSYVAPIVLMLASTGAIIALSDKNPKSMIDAGVKMGLFNIIVIGTFYANNSCPESMMIKTALFSLAAAAIINMAIVLGMFYTKFDPNKLKDEAANYQSRSTVVGMIILALIYTMVAYLLTNNVKTPMFQYSALYALSSLLLTVSISVVPSMVVSDTPVSEILGKFFFQTVDEAKNI